MFLQKLKILKCYERLFKVYASRQNIYVYIVQLLTFFNPRSISKDSLIRQYVRTLVQSFQSFTLLLDAVASLQ